MDHVSVASDWCMDVLKGGCSFGAFIAPTAKNLRRWPPPPCKVSSTCSQSVFYDQNLFILSGEKRFNEPNNIFFLKVGEVALTALKETWIWLEEG